MFLNPFLETSLKSLQEYTLIITPEIRQYWKDVGTRIKDIRKANNKTQKEMAIGANQLESAVNLFENGMCSTSIRYALYLRNEYEISFDWIYDGEVIDRRYEDVTNKKRLDPYAIGARLKSIRKDKGMSQIEFGKLLGMPNSTLSNYEQGRTIPEIKPARKIKQVTKKHLDWIYFGDEIIVPKSIKRAKGNQSSKKSKKDKKSSNP
ncbi:helix-turn-helix domain-containing protein [Candidatus Liberibacter asiaticus]|uniref:helix-turn-helix domain-containing protein n=1 Tax=Liberibacter asiaticus TaxID=34021 RepID=UPI0012F4C521|nr:helix-turn-helix transcriptional regulator [Candidatus Liberibacter asiaticus]KAE9515995.1 transcriptional repressor DicA [Candidatus Liberibacter asiaticus]UKY34153.1 helix-turn-helix transcriptional regulator [Candidatus Liberibacter asiaticus]